MGGTPLSQHTLDGNAEIIELNMSKEGEKEEINISISKDVLAGLPTEVFEGKSIVVSGASNVRKAIAQLRKHKLVGFDTETRPTFKKGKLNNVALIQLATEEKCYLFRIFKSGLTQEIIDFLEDPEITKVGLSIHDDFLGLSRIKPVTPGGFIDIQEYVKEFNIVDKSLSRIYGILFNKRISKGQQLSNWETSKLTDAQKKYASLDAVACIRIYDHLKKGGFDPESSPYIIKQDEEKV